MQPEPASGPELFTERADAPAGPALVCSRRRCGIAVIRLFLCVKNLVIACSLAAPVPRTQMATVRRQHRRSTLGVVGVPRLYPCHPHPGLMHAECACRCTHTYHTLEPRLHATPCKRMLLAFRRRKACSSTSGGASGGGATSTFCNAVPPAIRGQTDRVGVYT